MLTSIIRTFVPLLAGWLGPTATNWLGWTDAELTGVLVLVVSGAYYLVARLAEQVWPGAGVLLGVPVQPRYDRDGRHEAGRAEDGRSVLRAVLIGAALVGLVLVAVPASADAAGWRRSGPVEWVGVGSAQECGGRLTVGWLHEARRGATWVPVLDDGRPVRLQVHFIGNGAGPGGSWEDVPVDRRTEHWLSASMVGQPTYEPLVRVVVDGVASSAHPVAECSA